MGPHETMHKRVTNLFPGQWDTIGLLGTASVVHRSRNRLGAAVGHDDSWRDDLAARRSLRRHTLDTGSPKSTAHVDNHVT